MSEKIEPALTAEQWTEKFAGWARIFPGGAFIFNDEYVVRDADRHSLAALALHGQPFGFTREDVIKLRRGTGAEFLKFAEHMGITPAQRREVAWRADLADRIEALLPPENTANG